MRTRKLAVSGEGCGDSCVWGSTFDIALNIETAEIGESNFVTLIENMMKVRGGKCSFAVMAGLRAGIKV